MYLINQYILCLYISHYFVSFKPVAFSLSNTRVYFSIFVFSILVTIRVVHLMEQLLLLLLYQIMLYFQLNETVAKLLTFSTDLENQKSSTEKIETTLEQKVRQTTTELKCIKTDLSAFNQVNKDFLHIVKVKPINGSIFLSVFLWNFFLC